MRGIKIVRVYGDVNPFGTECDFGNEFTSIQDDPLIMKVVVSWEMD